MKRMNAALKVKRPAEAEAPAIDFDELPTYVGYQVRRTQAKIFGEFEATQQVLPMLRKLHFHNVDCVTLQLAAYAPQGIVGLHLMSSFASETRPLNRSSRQPNPYAVSSSSCCFWVC